MADYTDDEGYKVDASGFLKEAAEQVDWRCPHGIDLAEPCEECAAGKPKRHTLQEWLAQEAGKRTPAAVFTHPRMRPYAVNVWVIRQPDAQWPHSERLVVIDADGLRFYTREDLLAKMAPQHPWDEYTLEDLRVEEFTAPDAPGFTAEQTHAWALEQGLLVTDPWGNE
jgi:hypothetical protein